MQVVTIKSKTRFAETSLKTRESVHSDRNWSKDLHEQLKLFWQEGLSTAEIGKRIGKSKNAVVGKAHRLGLSRESPIKRGVERKPRTVARAPRITLAIKTEKSPPPPEPIPVYRGNCCFPKGEPGTKSFQFCDDPAIAGKPYCLPHCKKAYVDFDINRYAAP